MRPPTGSSPWSSEADIYRQKEGGTRLGTNSAKSLMASILEASHAGGTAGTGVADCFDSIVKTVAWEQQWVV